MTGIDDVPQLEVEDSEQSLTSPAEKSKENGTSRYGDKEEDGNEDTKDESGTESGEEVDPHRKQKLKLKQKLKQTLQRHERS